MATEEIPTKIKPPECIELRESLVDKKRIGSFSLEPIKKDTEFGPYEGRIVYDKDDESLDAKFSWEVFDLKTFKYLHTVDATNPDHGNWMRYVCCARYFEEQNIVSTQNGCEVFYRALKDIEAGEELLTWFQPKKKKRKKSLVRNLSDSVECYGATSTSLQSSEIPNNSVNGSDTQKRRRKPKVIPDAYDGPLDWSEKELPQSKKIKEDDAFEPLQPGQKRRRRKKASVDSVESESSLKATSSSADKLSNENEDNIVKPDCIKIEEDLVSENKDIEDEQQNSQKNKKSVTGAGTVRRNSSTSEAKKDNAPAMSIAEINNSVEWEFPPSGGEYNFVLKKRHIVSDSGKKIYKCDICLGLYKHMFSLKRHYLRNHINYKYLSKSDMTNCLINLAQVKHLMRSKFPEMKEKNEVKEEGGQCDNNATDKQGSDDVDSADTIKNEKLENVSSEERSEINNAINASSPKCVQDSAIDNQPSDGNTESNVNHDCNEDMNEVSSESKEEVKEESVEKLDNSNHDEMCNVDQSINTSDKENANSEKCVIKSETVEANNDVAEDKASDTVVNTEVNDTGDGIQTENKSVPMPGLFRCYTCYLTFDDFASIREHTQNHPEQTNGACFQCDICVMRFNYKHNLVRHRKTHDIAGKTLEGGDKKCEKADTVSPQKHLLPSKTVSSPEKKPLLLPTVFRCGVCPQKFDSQANVVKHVKEEHKNGSKFQCSYCGKDFLSMPNMKKHVRFHLGYRATCRICSEAFSNVGALRKHTRVAHPDIYKAKLIERLEKYGVLKGPDKNALSKDIIDKVNLSRKNSQETKEKESCEINKTEVKVETKVEKTKAEEDVEEVDNEINFTADEIDDGGSRFKFACTVCKKRFSSYINMCRHRRKIHTNENRHRTEQCLTFGRKPRNNPSPIFENPVEVAAFYANISHNIATNLNCYIDGKVESLQTFADHVKIENYNGNFGYSVENEQPNDLTLEKYNFPIDYKPIQTVSFADIKNVLNIHNDFDSHCMSVDERVTDSENNVKNSEEAVHHIDDKSLDEIEGDPNQGTRNYQGNYCSSDKGVDESLEDSEVREINSVKLEEEKTFVNKYCDLSKDSNIMGKSSHGLKAFANLGSALLKRGATDVKNAETVGKLSIGASIYTDSPAAKTFHQVKLGEYANFQDDLMPLDMDYPVTMETENTDSVQCNILTDKEKKYMVEASEMLNRSAQEQLESLYDSIDSCEPVTKITRKSPKALSELCEQNLGLSHMSKRNKAEASLNTETASQLELSTSALKDQYGQTAMDDGPNYADEPEESPFYNYESIMFGKNGNIQQVCGVCKKHFSDIDSLMRHHLKKHPSVQCSFLQVEQGFEIEDLHFSEPSTVGALAVTDPRLDNVADMDSFQCTNCAAAFKSISKLHVHMINCSSIDPIFGVQKMENGLVRTPMKKKLQRKIFSLFGNKTDARYDTNFLTFKLSQQRNDTQSPKRVFSGCRKRTSYILPDSPQKLVSEQKQLIPTSSGYNPQNHVRRRELTEILDTLTCEACGLKFKTIILLERHIKYCTKKEKFKSIQPMACPLIDESLEKIKNMCLYCNKNFTYTKSLVNHFQDFCPIKRAKLDKGELTEQDKIKEAEIIERIQKAEEEKAYKHKEIDSRPKRNMPWHVGRKSKRKGHSWTNIKKRNQQKQSSAGAETVEEYDDNDGYESSESESGLEENKLVIQDVDYTEGKMEEDLTETKSDGSDCVQIADSETCDKVKSGINDSECRGSQNSISDRNGISICNDPIVNTSIHHDEESNATVIKDPMPASGVPTAVAVVKEAMQPSDVMPSVAVLQDSLSNTSINSTDSSFPEKDSPLTLYTCIDVNNTSLNCTARYSVNLVNPVKKYRPIAPKPKSSSSMLECISKLYPLSKPVTTGTVKRKNKKATIETENSNDIESTESKMSVDSDSSSSAVEIKEEAKFKLAEQGLITGKRKRARVGKVEEFLRNAFKRKKNKMEQEKMKGEKEISFTVADKGYHETGSISHNLKPNLDCSEKSNTVDANYMKLSIGDASYLKSKQAEENTLNKISEVVLSKQRLVEDKQTGENAETTVQLHKTMSDGHNEIHKCQNVGNLTNEKGKSDVNSLSLDSVQKRGRGRPRGSGYEKHMEKKAKYVPGRKRGRPRKVPLPETSTLDNEFKCTSIPSVSKSDEFLAGNESDPINEPDNFDESDNNDEVTTTENSKTENISTCNIVKKSKTGENQQLGEAKENVCKSNNLEEKSHGNAVSGYIFNRCSGNEKYKEVNGNTRYKTESSDGFDHSLSNDSNEKIDEIVYHQKDGDTIVNECVTEVHNENEDHHFKNSNKQDFGVENVVKLKLFEISDEDKVKKTCIPKSKLSCETESFDEVDGICIENTESMQNRQDQFNQNHHTSCLKTDVASLTNSNTVTFISEQIAGKCPERITSYVVPSKDEHETDDDGEYCDANCGEMNNFKVECIPSCDVIDSSIECEQEQSNEKCSPEVSDKDFTATIIEINIEQKETKGEENVNAAAVREGMSESKTDVASDFDSLLEPVLSPGERVKMNKRSCKKDVDLSSPVWVKRTKVHKGKPEKKQDDLLNESEINRKTQQKSQKVDDSVGENACKTTVGHSNDTSLDTCRKRKISELDIDVTPKLKHTKHDSNKGTLKTNVRSKI